MCNPLRVKCHPPPDQNKTHHRMVVTSSVFQAAPLSSKLSDQVPFCRPLFHVPSQNIAPGTLKETHKHMTVRSPFLRLDMLRPSTSVL